MHFAVENYCLAWIHLSTKHEDSADICSYIYGIGLYVEYFIHNQVVALHTELMTARKSHLFSLF